MHGRPCEVIVDECCLQRCYQPHYWESRAEGSTEESIGRKSHSNDSSDNSDEDCDNDNDDTSDYGSTSDDGSTSDEDSSVAQGGRPKGSTKASQDDLSERKKAAAVWAATMVIEKK